MSQHPETRAIRIQTERTGEKEHSTPLFLTSSFTYASAEEMAAAFADDSLDVNIYSRFSNPTVDEFIHKMCALEETEDGIATSTGMAAVFSTFMTFLSAGDHILSASAVFGSTHALLTKYLPKWGITSSYFNMGRPEEIEAMIRPNTKMLYVETPSNPGLDIIDMEYVSGICKKHGILFVVDNCFATPAIQKPMQWGADLVIHSATKFIDGQGRVLGGVVVGPKSLIQPLYLFVRNTGPSMSPFNAWVLTKSLETLHLRMEYVSGICKKHGILFVVDNCFATPAIQKPMLWGADLVIHSATKFIDGQGRVLGGVVVGPKALIQPLYLFVRNTGPSMSPFNAWVLTKSLETLHLRMEYHAKNATALAAQLQHHPMIRQVKYPFLEDHPQFAIARKQMKNGGGLITFELKGGLESGRKFLNALKMCSMTNNLGDSRTIASHPASTTHSKLTEPERQEVGITPGLIRISVGLEHIDDILSDIRQALEKC
jgi:cystathionine beta-lyase/cystathionine gamma-synthase